MIIYSISCLFAVMNQVGGYADIPANHWASSSVEKLVSSYHNTRPLVEGRNSNFKGDEPVTRYEFAVIMDKFITDIRKAFVRQPDKKQINASKIKGKQEDGSQRAMIKLAEEGFLPYYSPVFHGPDNTITAAQMAHALSQIARRIGWCFRKQDDG